jgi:hypothetical protein
MMTRFQFRYDRWCGWLLGLLGHGRRLSHLDVDETRLTVQMGYGFRATVPRTSIADVRPSTGRVWGWGVHGWKGRWLVNGSSHGIVVLDLEPPVPARVLLIPITLRELAVSLEAPDEFVAAISPR